MKKPAPSPAQPLSPASATAPRLAARLTPLRGPWPLRLSDVRGAARLAVEATLGVTDVVEQLHHTILRRAAPLSLQPVAAPGPTGGITGLAYRSVRGVTRGVGQGLDLLLGPGARRVTESAPVQALLRAAQVADPLADPSAADEAPSQPRQALLAALNGVVGDHLHDSDNPLALPMVLRQQGRVLKLEHTPQGAPGAGPGRLAFQPHNQRARVLLMVHGLCMSPWQWQRQGPEQGQDQEQADVDLGQALADQGELCLLHLHYNTGLPVATNGRLLADRLQALQDHWPVPLQELVVVGHSMGGLVARSACHVAQQRGDTWLQRLSTLVCLGTPHHGAPLERGGRGVDLLLGISPYTAAFARLGKLRSAGITDLRHGSVRPPLEAEVAAEAAPEKSSDPATERGTATGAGTAEQSEATTAHATGNTATGASPPADSAAEGARTAQPPPQPPHQGVASDPRPPTPLPGHVRCFAIAGQVRHGALAKRLGPRAKAWLGDGLVPVDSALGQHPQAAHCLDFPPAHRWVGTGLDHFALMRHPAVLAQLVRWGVGSKAQPVHGLGRSVDRAGGEGRAGRGAQRKTEL